MRWFNRAGVDFLASIPRADGAPFTAATALFEPQPPGGGARHLAIQLAMLAQGGRDGGLFIMIGRKRR